MCSKLGWTGSLRLVTIFIGVIDFWITADSFLRDYQLEGFFLAVVGICLFMSCVVTLALILGVCKEAEWAGTFDMSFHVLSALGLLIGSICMFVSVSRFGHTYQRIFTGILGMGNAFLYGTISMLLYRSSY